VRHAIVNSAIILARAYQYIGLRLTNKTLTVTLFYVTLAANLGLSSRIAEPE